MAKRYGIGVMWTELAASLLSKPTTVLYPVERLPIPERFRGRLHLDTNSCTLCGLCERDCPCDVIEVVRERVEGPDGKKQLVGHLEFKMDQCIFCGQCELSCNSNSITFSNEYEMAQPDKELFNVYVDDRLRADTCELSDEDAAEAASVAEGECAEVDEE